MPPKPNDNASKLIYLVAIPLFVLDVIVYVIKFILDGKYKTMNEEKNYSVAFGDATETRGAPRRNADSNSTELMTTFGDAKATTVYEMVQSSIQTYGPKNHIAMKCRRLVEIKKLKETDRFPSKIFNDKDGFETISYQQLGQNIRNFGAGLRELGMEPIPANHDPSTFDTLKGSFTMVIFEDTCYHWTTALQGAFSQSMTVATCYATLGHDAVVAAVQETSATTLFVGWKHVEDFVKRANDMPSLKIIIASSNEMPAGTQIFKPTGSSPVKVVAYDDVIAMGSLNDIEPTPPKPSDVAVIMYTSGSTGKPKGVVMRHSHLVSGVAGMAATLTVRPGKEVFLSYLPLAHILALQVENGLLGLGGTLCYADPRELAKALPMFKPTIFAGVPKVWEMLRSGLEKQLDKGPPALKLVFETLVEWKIFALKQNADTPVSNLFFDLLSKKVFGGTIQFGVSGGGPLSAELHYFCRACFNCPLIQGYALTETCVGGCFQSVDDTRCGVVGPPVPCVEVALQSEPDIKDGSGLPYLCTDKVGSKGEKVIGRGEICIRGPAVSAGYYKLPDKTKEEFDDEGFFHTGDIGQFTADGVIQIVDRKKNLVKLKGGEYVAVEAMESAFGGSKFVTALCVLATGDMDGPLVVATADEDTLKAWAGENDIKYGSMKELGEMKETRQAVVKSMVDLGKQAGLTKLELRVKDCCIITGEQWLPGHGMTASMKLDRKAIQNIYKDQLKELYERNDVNVTE